MGHSVALTLEEDQVSMVDESVNHGGRHLVVREDTTSLRELQVRGRDEVLYLATNSYPF